MTDPVIVLNADLEPEGFLIPCPATTMAVLGFRVPTEIPCGDVAGHDGPHHWAVEWANRDAAP